MTIKDLIQKLQQDPEDLEVGIKGCRLTTFMSGDFDRDEVFKRELDFRVVGYCDYTTCIGFLPKDHPGADGRALCLS